MKRGISFYIFYVLISIGVLAVLYFSWISSPKLENNWLVPYKVAKWADSYENMNLRTAIPFFFIGIFSGFLLILKNSSLRMWIFIWVLLSLLALLAEFGQFFRPYRIFDKGDIKWGVLGSTLGLLPIYGLFLFLKRNKRIK